MLAVTPPGVEADHRQQLVRRSGIRTRVPDERAFRELARADPPDPRRRAGEVPVDEAGRETDGLEHLGAAVRRERGDAHLRDRLQEALADRLERALLGVLDAHVQPALGHELPDRREHQIGVDGCGAVADQHGDALHAPGLAGLDDQPRLEPCAGAHQVVMDGADGEEGRHRDALGPDVPVGDDQDAHAVGQRRVGLGANPLERRLEPVDTLGDGPREVDRVRLEHLGVDLPEALEILVAQDRVVDHELPCVLGRLVEQVSLRADERLHAHDDGLTDRIDRRVRHLCEQLLEIGVEQRPPVGEDGERRVVPHRADRFLAVDRERRQHHLHVLLRVAKRELQPAHRLTARARRRPRRQVGEPHVFAVEPLAVRAAARDLCLHLRVGNDPALLEVDEEQLARL